MKRSTLTLTLCLTLVMSLSNAKADNSGGFLVGQYQPNYFKLKSFEEQGIQDSKYCSTNLFKTYSVEDNQTIRHIVCENIKSNDTAAAAIVAGGPGHSYVTIAYTMPRSNGNGMKFRVKIYGV